MSTNARQKLSKILRPRAMYMADLGWEVTSGRVPVSTKIWNAKRKRIMFPSIPIWIKTVCNYYTQLLGLWTTLRPHAKLLRSSKITVNRTFSLSPSPPLSLSLSLYIYIYHSDDQVLASISICSWYMYLLLAGKGN